MAGKPTEKVHAADSAARKRSDAEIGGAVSALGGEGRDMGLALWPLLTRPGEEG